MFRFLLNIHTCVQVLAKLLQIIHKCVFSFRTKYIRVFKFTCVVSFRKIHMCVLVFAKNTYVFKLLQKIHTCVFKFSQKLHFVIALAMHYTNLKDSFMHLCMHARVYVWHLCVFLTRIHLCIYVCMHVCMYGTFAYSSLMSSLSSDICEPRVYQSHKMYIYVYIYIYTYIHIHIYIYIYVYTGICTAFFGHL